MTCISSANHSLNRLDDVLSRARERCQIANTRGASESQTPNSGTGTPNPTKPISIYDCIEKALGFGLEPPVFQGKTRPPLVTYTVTPTQGGSVHRATDQYVFWYRETFGFDKTPDRGCPRPARRSDQDLGGAPEF